MLARERSRARIITAALRLAARPSVSALQMQALATEAGVGRATLYRIYPTLEAVLADAMAYWVVSTAGRLRQLVLPQHPRDRVHRILDALVGMLAENRALLQFFLPAIVAARDTRLPSSIPALESLIPVALSVALEKPESALPQQTTRLLQYALLAGVVRLASGEKGGANLLGDLCLVADTFMPAQAA